MNPLGSQLRVLALALTLLVASCALPPHRSAPPAPMSDAALGLSGVAVAPADDQWWRSLNDAQLDRLIEAALRDNPSLAQAGARLRAAQAQAEAARAGQLPNARLSAGETRLKIPSGFPPALDAGATVWAGDLGARLSWDVDLWGKQSAAVSESRSLVQAADLDVAQARLLITGAVVQAYIDLYRNYALADIAEQAQAQRLNILELTRKRLGAGLDTRVELREAEGAVPQAQVTMLQARSAEALAVHELIALSGHGADAYAGITRPTLDVDAVLPLPQELPMNLLARRPDVIAARARIAAADSGQRAARAAFYPAVNLSALAGFASFKLSDLISASSFGYGAGPALSLPLFDGGRLSAQYHGAEAQLAVAVDGYDDTVLSAVRQAADQISLISALQSELESQKVALDAAEDAYRLAEERYGAGLASYLSVLNAETEVFNQRRQRVELSSALALARVTLLLSLGGNFQAPAFAPTASVGSAASGVAG